MNGANSGTAPTIFFFFFGGDHLLEMKTVKKNALKFVMHNISPLVGGVGFYLSDKNSSKTILGVPNNISLF